MTSTRRMALLVLLALGILAVLSLASFSTIQTTVQSQDLDSYSLSLALRERLLIERIRLFGTRLVQGPDVVARGIWRKNLETAVQQLEKISTALAEGSPNEGLLAPRSEEVLRILHAPPYQLHPATQRYIEETRSLLRIPGVDLVADNTHLRYLGENESPLLDAVDALALRFEEERAQHVESIRTLSVAIVSTTILSLILIGVFLFRPMIRRIQKDIEERGRYEEELSRHRDHLEVLLHEKTQKLEENYRKLKDSERLASLGQMAAQVAHEIKNPLAGIRGIVTILSRSKKHSPENAELVEDLIGEINRLDSTVSDLLHFARPVHPRKVRTELYAFLEEIKESWLLQPRVGRHRVEIDASPELAVPLDLILMDQALRNLVQNSAQAMVGPGTIRITARAVDGLLQIAVEDSGPGIPKEVLPKIFDPFFTTKTRGTGLGLAIAKKNIEALGGSIEVDSPPRNGARFVMHLPLEIPTVASSSA